MSESVQVRNDQLVNWLSADFQPRYDPAFSWKTSVSMMTALPVVRAVWPMSSMFYTTNPICADVSGQSNNLSISEGNPFFGYDPGPALAPVVQFPGTVNQELFRADGGAGNWADITGGETYVIATQRGLTLGGWFKLAALPNALTLLIDKDDGGANRQYRLYITAANLLTFEVWAGPVSVASSAALVVGWNHCVGVYDQPSQTLYTVLNGVVTEGVVGAAPAALADTGALFEIGGVLAGFTRLSGYASMCWLEACSLRQGGNFTHAKSLFWQQAAMFGKIL